MKPVAWVKYSVGKLPHFVPVIGESAMFECSAIEALEYEPLYTADQLRAAKVEVLRKLADDITDPDMAYLIRRRADALKELEK